MANSPDLALRMRMLGIGEETYQAAKLFSPVFVPNIGRVARGFYKKMLGFEEVRDALAGIDVENSLEPRQIAHWIRLFSCRFDRDYVEHAVRIGEAHFQRGVAPHLYIAGYNYFQCELVGLATRNFRNARELHDIITAIVRLAALDMDLALSVYIRAHWQLQDHPAASKRPADTGPEDEADIVTLGD